MMHETFMSHALQLAKKGKYTVSPNPMVGCVIVKDNKIIGEGFHKKAGEAHAEIHALNNTQASLEDATLYVTLEPCAHTGKTPPCVDSLIQSGIKKIVIGTIDPNPLVSGKGIEKLKNAGIQVTQGVLQDEAKKLNEKFFYFIKHKKPYVILKWAMSLDGKTTTNQNDSNQISSAESQKHTHDLRESVDAVLIGARTALSDDPLLNVRFSQNTSIKQPVKIILTSHTKIPATLNLMKEGQVIIATNNPSLIDETVSASFILTSSLENGEINLNDLLSKLAEKNITSILVEGGMKTHEQFIQQHCVNKIMTYLAPAIIGQLDKKIILNNARTTSLGEDLLLEVDYV